MDISGINVLVTAAILLGILHAFDVDHLLTVVTLSSAKSGNNSSIRYCAHWAVGHGVTIMALAMFVYFAGLTLPAEFSEIAEALVGIVLVTLGLWMLKSILNYVLARESELAPPSTVNTKTPFAIGTLHGFAGSAPILLVFLVDVHTALQGLGSILIFVVAVFLAMTTIGIILGKVFSRVSKLGQKSIHVTRGVLASVSILIGGSMVYGYF